MPQMPTPSTRQVGDRHQQQRASATKRDGEADAPAARRLRREDDRADLVGDRAEGVPGLDDRRRAARLAAGASLGSTTAIVRAAVSISGFGIRRRGQVGRPRPRVQLVEQPVVARLVLAAARPGSSGSLMSPKTIASRGTGLLAGGHDLAVADRAVLALRASISRRVDALHAVGALLHHAAAADRHVGVAPELERSASSSPAYRKKLNRRTLYGQLFEQ